MIGLSRHKLFIIFFFIFCMSIPVLNAEIGSDNTTMNWGEENDDEHNHHMRSLQEEAPCQVTNQIDRCWKCQPNWAQNRKRLADCVIGFARGTTGGKHGKYYVVTSPAVNATHPNPGTLRHAAIQNEPLWITFKHSMRITLQQELIMTSNKTIDGRGAIVTITGGAGITIQFVQNIIIHNIFIQYIVSTPGGNVVINAAGHLGYRTRGNGDGVSIYGSKRIWLDHLTMKRCTDGMIDATEGSTAITISNCLLSHHNKTILLGANDMTLSDKALRASIVYNHFGKKLTQRLPRVRSGFAHVVNNDYTHWEMYAIGGSNNPTIISQGNYFVASNNPFTKEVGHRVYATQAVWSKWTWCSDRDIYRNGAVFTTSGDCSAENIAKLASLDGIAAEDGIFTKKLTRYAGVLDFCKSGMECSKLRIMRRLKNKNAVKSRVDTISWLN